MKQIISLSEVAIKKIISVQKLNESANFPYLDISGGGCSGIECKITLKKELTEDDVPFFSSPELTVYGNKELITIAQDCSVEFVDEIAASKFVFRNPNATSSCSCGKSFGL